MSLQKVNQLLQYKFKEGEHFFFVQWDDGTTTWSRLRDLACKDLVVNFLRRCTMLLQDKLRQENVAKQKLKEEELLKRIINKNSLSSSKGTEIIVDKTKIINSIIQKVPENRQNIASSVKTPFFTSESSIKAVFKGLKHDFKKPISNQTISAETNPNKVLSQIAKNSGSEFTIRFNENVKDTLIFYGDTSKPKVEIPISDFKFVHKEEVAPTIISLFSKQSKLFELYPISNSEIFSKEMVHFLDSLKSFGLIAVAKIDKEYWLIYTERNNDNLFGIKSNTRQFIIKITKSLYLDAINEVSNVKDSCPIWNNNSYEVALQCSSDLFFKDQSFPFGGKTFFVGDETGFSTLHSLRHARNVTEITSEFKEATNCIISYPFTDYIHQLKTLDFQSNKEVNVFELKGISCRKIMENIGIVCFSDDFLKSYDLLKLIDFISSVHAKSGWALKTSRFSFKSFKKRITEFSPESSELDLKLKKVYKILKDGIVDYAGRDLKNFLQKMFWDQYKFFVLVGQDLSDKQSSSLEEAAAFIGISHD